MKWTKKMTPEAYLKRFPDTKDADVARAAVAAGEGERAGPFEFSEAEPKGAAEPEVVEERPAEITVPEEMSAEAGDLVQKAQDLNIQTEEQYAWVADFIGACKALRRKIEEYHNPNIKRWYEGHSASIAAKKKDLEPVEQAISIAEQKLREHRAELRRLEEERRRKAQEALEAQRAAEEEGEEEVPFVEEVELAEREAINALVTPPVEAPKVEGMAVREIWRWKPDPNCHEVINGVPATVSREFLTWDTKKINDTVRALKQDSAKVVGGIVPYAEESFAHRG